MVHIAEVTVFDGEGYVTIAPVISNGSGVIKILRMKHNDTKMYIVAEVVVSEKEDDVSKLPY